jgi:hypothetical protein
LCIGLRNNEYSTLQPKIFLQFECKKVSAERLKFMRTNNKPSTWTGFQLTLIISLLMEGCFVFYNILFWL